MTQVTKICFLIIFANTTILIANSKQKPSLLFQAILKDDLQRTTDLATKENINETDELNISAVYLAAMKGHHKMLELFISLGANSFVQNKITLETALHLAVYARSFECVKILLESSAPTDIQDKHMQTPLAIAYKLKEQVIIDLLENWSEDTVKRIPIHTLLGNIAWSGYFEKNKKS